MNRPAHPARLRVMTANIEYHDRAPQLATALQGKSVDVAFIQQANPAIQFLHGIRGMHLHRVGDTAEAHDLAMLVRNGHRITRQVPIQVPGSEWTGPIHGLHHGDKVFHAALIDDLVWVVNVHIPTQRPESNHAARERCFDRLAEFAENHPQRPILMGGDWNTPASALAPFAERIGAEVTGTGIDVFLGRGVRHVGRGTTSVPRPSDTHGWVIADFEIGD